MQFNRRFFSVDFAKIDINRIEMRYEASFVKINMCRNKKLLCASSDENER